MQNFYIIENDKKLGPFDAMSMIKKIRNGKLQPTSYVLEENAEQPVAANKVKLFYDYFIENEFSPQASQTAKSDVSPQVFGALKRSWSEYEDNKQGSVIALIGFFAIIFVAVFFNAFLPSAIVGLITSALAGAGLFAFTAYMGSVHRQTLDAQSLKNALIQGHGVRMLLAGAVIGLLLFGLPALLTPLLGPFSLLLLLLGFMGFTFFWSAPLFWLSDTAQQPIMTHLRASIHSVTRHDADTVAKMLTLSSINALGCALFVLPIIITMPVTTHAWVDLHGDSHA